MFPDEVSAAVRRYLLADREDAVRVPATELLRFADGTRELVAPESEFERVREVLAEERRKDRLRRLIAGGPRLL